MDARPARARPETTLARILLFPIGSAGDVHPFIGIGQALQARGNHVVIGTSGYFEDTVRKAGLEFAPIGTREDFEKALADPDLWNPSKAFETVIRKGVENTYQPILEAARRLHKPGETIIVGATLSLGARTAAEAVDAPYVSVHLAPSVFLGTIKPPVFPGMIRGRWVPRWAYALQLWVGRRMTDKIALPGLNKFRAGLGLPPAREVVRDWWHSPKLTIGLFPGWFAAKQPDWPAQTRLTGFPLFDEKGQRETPSGLREFLDAGEPPILFTPGSAMAHGQEFFRESVAACNLLGRRGLLLSQFPETVPADLPPTVAHFTYAPFSEVMPRCAALVSHGGIGTCAQALRAGIPHLVQHMAHDQPDNAQRLIELGVGDGIAVGKFRAKAAARKLAALLDDPRVTANCKSVAARFAPEQWIQQTCELIEQQATE